MNNSILVKLLLLSIGILIGTSMTFFAVKGSNRSDACIEHEARNFLVDSIINSMNLIDSGNADSAQPILATAVNSQIIIIKKMKSSSPEENAKSDEWKSLMQKHNDRLGIKIPEKTQ